MALSESLVSKFAKLVKTDNSKQETTVYGTIIENDGSKFVKIDGSEYLTPISTTVDAVTGERVTVLIKNHTAMVTGNITSPAARNEVVMNIDNRTTPSKLVDLLYPVGSIYLSVNETTPENLFGGKWEQIEDRFLLASGSRYTPGNTGGSEILTITASNLPGEVVVATKSGGVVGSGSGGYSAVSDISDSAYGIPLNNMPPYLVVYMWKRIE